MALPVFRRLTIADIPDTPEWMNGVFGILNLFGETTVQVLNKGLTIGDNVQGSVYNISINTSTGYATGDFTPITYRYSSGGRPASLLIGQITDSSGALILAPVSVTSWFLNLNTSPPTITVNYIAGLSPNKRYNITLLAL